MVLAWIAIAAAALGQESAPQQPPVFKAGVELVRLDVRVTDADGRPIPDLRQAEVEVLEGGRPRPVVFFQHVEGIDEPYADIARRTVASEVSTNQGAARGHLYVLVFDQQHIAPGDEQRARLAAERFITTKLKPGDRVALYALPGPGPDVPFTPDRPRLLRELQKVRGMSERQAFGAMGTMTLHEASEIVRGNEQMVQRVADRVRALAAVTDVQRRNDPSNFATDATPLSTLVQEDARRITDVADGESRRVLAMLADVLRPMRAIEGRKTILLVSEGFNGDRLSREIENVAAAAAQSYSVVYAMDVNRHEIDAAADQPIGGDQANEIQDRLAPMGSLAAETGGRLLIDAGRRADDIFDALAAQEDYYLVGFTPSDSASSDRAAYRRVAVHIARRGAVVSTRTGFTLTDAAARLDRHQAIDRAMAAPFAQQGLPIEYTTYVLRGDAPGLQHVILAAGVELPIAQPNAAPAAVAPVADVAFVVRSAADGRVAASGHDVIALPAGRVAGATTGAGSYRVQFDAPAGEYVMRLVVREPGGLVGSADRRFTVRALEGPSLTSGDLIVSSVPGELPVRPTAYVGDGLSGVVELYGRTAEQLRAVRVVVDLMPAGESSAIVSGSCDLQDVRRIAGGVARSARLELPLAGIPAGAYVARARVMSGSDTVAEAARAVDIRSGDRPSTVDAGGNDLAAFDPREVVNGAFAREFAARLIDAGPPVGFEGTRGLERLAARDYPSAIASFETVLGAAADKSIAGPAAFLLGWAYHGAGDDRQAISAWRRAAFVDPTIVPAHLALADMYLRLSQPALAIQALRAGLAALPHSPELNDRLSRIGRP
jgi:VWFA-related protein